MHSPIPIIDERHRSSNSAASPPRSPGPDSSASPTPELSACHHNPAPKPRAALSAPNSPLSQTPAAICSTAYSRLIQPSDRRRRLCWRTRISERIRGRNRRRCFRRSHLRPGRRSGGGRSRRMHPRVVWHRDWGRWIIVQFSRAGRTKRRGVGFS